MSQQNQLPNGIYQINPELSSQHLSDAINMYLSKAEALAAIAATINLETYNTEIVNNYLWTLSDTIREAKRLYKNSNNQILGK